MYEYEVQNRQSGEYRIITGYSLEDACRRRHLNPDEWLFISRNYYDIFADDYN